MPSRRFPSLLALLVLLCLLSVSLSAVPSVVSRGVVATVDSFVPVSVAVDAAGSMHVLLSECACIVTLSSDGHRQSQYNTTAPVAAGQPPPYASQVALDATGALYLAGLRNLSVPLWKLSPQGELLAEYVTPFSSDHSVSWMAVDPAGTVYGSNPNAPGVYSFSSNLTLLPLVYTGTVQPGYVAVDRAGGLWVLGFLTGDVAKFAANGTQLLNITVPQVCFPFAMAVDSADNVLLMGAARARGAVSLCRYSPDGTLLATIKTPLNVSLYPSFSLDAADNIYYTASDAIVKLSSQNGAVLASYNGTTAAPRTLDAASSPSLRASSPLSRALRGKQSEKKA